MVDETISSFQILSQTHYIIWEKQICKDTIWADRQRIEQVLINLLSNAIKYSPGSNKIILTTLKEPKKITLCVQDFGIGITL